MENFLGSDYLETKGYIYGNKIYIPECPYCGKKHSHYKDIDYDLGRIVNISTACQISSNYYRITISSRKDILNIINKKLEYKKIENLFKLYEKMINSNNLNLNKSIVSNNKLNKKQNELIDILKYKKIKINRIKSDIIKDSHLSEMVVIFQAGILWNKLSEEIGLVHIKEFHTNKFPDLIGLKADESGSYKHVYVEFETVSSNFIKHKHSINDCNVIICWKHDWIECPKNIKVIELCNMIEKN